MTTAVEFKNVDILFGKDIREALAMLDAGKSRAEILEKTSAVLGSAGANLVVKEGEISVLMGLSGSGKSTLLRAVNGLNKVSRGNVLVRDGNKMVDVVTCDEATLRHVRQGQVAMVFQQFALLPWRTVAENVGFGLELAGMPEDERKVKVDKQLKLVGLDQWAGKYVHELSGGMQQRVGLARAFATEAPILLMDEPFSALDPLIRTKLQDELLQLQKTLKKTIIFVSHDLEEALKIGNHISIMEGGRIVQTGRPEDIVLRPANDYVSEFIANVNPLSVLTAWNVMRGKVNWNPPGRVGSGLTAARRPASSWTKKTWLPPLKEMARWQHGFLAPKLKRPWARMTIRCSGPHPAHHFKTVMLAMHRADTAPVALFNDDSTFAGAIGVRDVLQAVLRRSE